MAWDEKATELLGEEITDILDNNDISVYHAEETDRGLEIGLEFYSDAGEDFIIDLNCDSAESFAEAFSEYARDFDPEEHAEMWIEARGTVSGVPQEISTLLEDANSIKEFLESVSAELEGKEYVRDEVTVQLTLDRDELEKLADMAGVEVNELDNETIISTLHSAIEQVAEPELTVSEEEIIEWGKAQISELTYGAMKVELESASYDDFLSAETIMSAFNEYRESGSRDDFKEFFYDKSINSWADEAMLYEENEIYSKLQDLAETETINRDNPDFLKAFEKLCEDMPVYEVLEMFDFEGVSVDLDSYVRNDYHINLMFATEQEKNLDMTAIEGMIPALDDVSDTYLHSEADYVKNTDNALTYLIHQQGHTVEELFEKVYGEEPEIAENDSKEALSETKGRDSDFIQSVANEINENYYGGMTELTALTSVKGEQLFELLDNIAHGNDYIVLPKETEVGLFNEWSGAGSSLEITAEKDIVIPADMVRNIQFEGTSHEGKVASNEGYTVDEVYGLIGSVWEKSSVEVTSEAPVLREENMKDVQAKLIEHKDNLDKEVAKLEKKNKDGVDR